MKRILALILASFMILSTLVACNSNQETKDTEKEIKTETLTETKNGIPIKIISSSMEPLINKGDTVFVKKIDCYDIEVGDVIAFFDPDDKSTIIVNRIVDIYITEQGHRYAKVVGDNNTKLQYENSLEEAKLMKENSEELINEINNSIKIIADPHSISNADDYTNYYTYIVYEDSALNKNIKEIPLTDEIIIGEYTYKKSK